LLDYYLAQLHARPANQVEPAKPAKQAKQARQPNHPVSQPASQSASQPASLPACLPAISSMSYNLPSINCWLASGVLTYFSESKQVCKQVCTTRIE